MTPGFEWDALLGAALRHAATYRRSLSARPVRAEASTESMLQALDGLGAMPLEGRAPAEVLDELAAAVATLRSVLGGSRIQVRCLECGPVAPAPLTRQDKGLLAAIAEWF